MKKLLTIILILALAVPAAAFADLPDISNLSYDELVQLKDSINLAMWNSQEWQEVTVPQGVWIVGKDIPAGTWTVKCATDSFSSVTYGDTLNEMGTGLKYSKYYHSENVTSPDYKHFEKDKDIPEYTFTVRDGDYIEIDFASVIFMPNTGKPSLGFK